MKGLLLVVLGLGLASAQKLFFKSSQELRQNVQEEVKGFGFKEPRRYFTSRLAAKEMAPKKPVGAVICPDKKTACPDGSTCCAMITQPFGCCHMMNAVCCSDRQHCCPFRTTCDVIRQTCVGAEVEIPWSVKESAFLLSDAEDHHQDVSAPVEEVKGPDTDLKSVLCPDGAQYCPDGHTCCKKNTGEYACCPYPKADCCSDGVHCCPQDYTCDLAHGRCVKQGGAHTLDLFRKTLAMTKTQTTKTKQELPIQAVKCDNEHECPTGNTCCDLGSGKWGCCPLAQAVCCSDHVHCCPAGTTCDVSSGKCNRGNIQIDWFERQPAQKVGMVQCDDSHECPDGNTCCQLSGGQWGCCPLRDAVCCSDHVHCCPGGTTCDVSSGKCNRGNIQIDWFERQPAQKVGMVKCDSTHECPDGNTCCQLSGGQWGCCPLRDAVCCSDHVHCCPGGTTCDVSSGKCNRGNIQIDWFERQPAQKVGMVKCDSTHECPDGNTCCQLSGGQWGCCPLRDAVCCSDHVHCCPGGTTCDVSSGKCNRGNIQIDWFERQPAQKVGMVKCDSTHECPDGNTCCQLSGGQWGCCPLRDAVCCSDHVHCCPGGTTCDVSSGKCNRGNIQIDWFERQPAQKVGMVKCDSTHECPDGNTCCQLSGGQWGCCPLRDAVCCSDHVHCCPGGTTCDVSSGKCNRGNIQIDWFERQPAQKVGMVKCDSTHECPDGNTCCQLSGGQWGCCPLRDAVCCSDHVHCCPGGTTCDVSSGKCNRGNIQIDWFERQPAQKVGMVKCDSTHECPDGNTCCQLSGGQWGCCPLRDAVCCSDHVHCCPGGTTCDVSSGKCNRGNIQIDWFERQPAQKVGMVKCDSTHECPDGNTCCQLSGGQWGCCPLRDAVCCSDHVHCCPGGTTCDVSSGKCNRGNIQIDWFERQPAQKVGMVKCDSTHECPDGNTCCQLSGGQWGCCPLRDAVCCSDHVHCCPGGTTCDVSSGKCNRGNIQIDWFERQPAQKVGMVKCDSTHDCPDGNTCCQLSGGQWGCCPLRDAVCCSDHVHCCPGGTTCDVSSGKCNRGNIQIDWFERQPAQKVGMVKCDSTHECPDGNTCCQLSGGQWGCCPLRDAVCCSDHVHCCPGGTTCDVSSGKCNRGNIQIDWFERQPAQKVGMVKCDSTHECPDGNTCCQLSGGQWGCCPLRDAVCCSDHVHCCPGGTTCDVSSGKCNRGNIQIDWFERQPAQKVGMVKCDSTHDCPDGNTCCQLSGGQWGCCPLRDAVCCSDHVHCCPGGTTCDVSSGKCNRGNIQIDWFERQPAQKVGMVKCDSTHKCPDGNTCCKLSGGQWGCCPLPDAVCCSDHVHCCPGGTTCDVSSGKCNRGNIQIDWFERQPAQKVGMVQCDSTHECPDNNTCCKLSGGQWGCCPLPDAVCCSDHVHCCPGGTTCDVSSGKCNRGNIQIDWFKKQPAQKVGMVQCDSTHECPDNNTCCKLSGGQWGCCPLPDAVCCSDHVHCCPGGTTCDVSSGKCNRGNIQIDWFKKQPAQKVGMVKCDSTHECPDNNTCCKLSGGQWGCCPLPDAVCCSDHVHCCPGGTTCDVSSGKCNRGNIQIDWFERQPAQKVGMVQCDSTHKCPDGNTCCKLSGGQWGCCPLPDAVCCSDHVHCCPGGTTCDVSSGKCNRGNIQIDWFEKQPAQKVGMVQCDSTHECPDGNTCCQLSGGQWGCCPLPDAVCCSDHVHCCPGGTTCDVSSGKCNRGNIQIDWFKKQPAQKVGMVQCDSTHECPDNNTCCKLSGGQWGCCPLPDAVCCSDHVHCCPGGTTCDVSSGKCNRGNIQIDWFKRQPAQKVGMVKCDSTHDCPDGNTCCQLSGGQWGCCPLPDAVCCSDHVHCCPGGTTCDVSSGKCNRGNIQIDWFERQPAQKVGMVKCDATHVCPDGNTCCKQQSGEWGCCQLEKAVCCSDGAHCCPTGTTCDLEHGKCIRASIDLHGQTLSPSLLSSSVHVGLPVVSVLELSDVICPDGSECKDGQTCCEMDQLTGSYGCCPLPNAVCCSDEQHCCPNGYRCDMSKGACVRGIIKLPWIENVKHAQRPAFWPVHEETSSTEVGNVNVAMPCPGGVSCPQEDSCCSDGKESYLCCPYPKGVCCDDHQHCCPSGYICDQGPNVCRIPENSKAAASEFLRKLLAQKNSP